MTKPRWHPCLTLACPRHGCHARPDQYCRSVGTGLPKRWPHAERKRAFRAQVLARATPADQTPVQSPSDSV